MAADAKLIYLPTQPDNDVMRRRGLHAELSVQARLDGGFTHAVQGTLPHASVPDMAEYLGKVRNEFQLGVTRS